MKLGPDGIERRIKKAGDKYVGGEITVDELEREIDRAFDMEYSYEELLMCSEFYRPADVEGTAMILGKEIEPGGSIRLDDIFDIDPLDHDVCPY